MLAFTPSSLLPRVTLTATSSSVINSTVISLPYNTISSWQWVAMDMVFIASGDYTLSVTMETINVDGSLVGSLYFDDFCLTIVSPGKWYI